MTDHWEEDSLLEDTSVLSEQLSAQEEIPFTQTNTMDPLQSSLPSSTPTCQQQSVGYSSTPQQQSAGPSPTPTCQQHSAGPSSTSTCHQLSTAPSSTPNEDPPLSRIGLNDHKAGMKGLDKGRINEIIVGASKGSKFYQNELRKDQEIKKRVDVMLHKLSKLTAAQKAEALHCADMEVGLLERGRDLSHVIVHVDMDAFYAAVEMRDNPSWREIPMAVGSKSMLRLLSQLVYINLPLPQLPHSLLGFEMTRELPIKGLGELKWLGLVCGVGIAVVKSTSNYVARRYGVRAAMPGFIAKKLCPELLIVPPHFNKYQQVSEHIQEVLRGYDSTFCPMGLDEAYLDITSCVEQRLQQDKLATYTDGGFDGEHATAVWSQAVKVVEEVRATILERTGLTASAGIAPNKMLAKIASDMNKPNGQYLVKPTRDAVLSFMNSLPIRKVSGIGKVTEKMLNALNVTVCHDLYKERETLHLVFSPSSARFFLSVSLGISNVQVQRTNDRKGISTERSFTEISNPDQLKQKCLELCQRLAQDMEAENIRGYTITLKLKTIDFVVKSRAVTLSQPVSKCKDLFKSAKSLLEEEMRSSQQSPLKLRLMGVRVSSLTSKRSKDKQQSLVSFLEKKQTCTSSSVVRNTSYASQELSHITTAGSRGDIKNSATVGQEITFVCPVCEKAMSADNAKLNYHIDQCLNTIAVDEAVKQEKLKI